MQNIFIMNTNNTYEKIKEVVYICINHNIGDGISGEVGDYIQLDSGIFDTMHRFTAVSKNGDPYWGVFYKIVNIMNRKE